MLYVYIIYIILFIPEIFEEIIELHQQYLLIGALNSSSLGGEFPGLVEYQAKLPTFGVP